MDDDQYLEELMTQVSARKIRSLDDVADDVRSNLNKAVESIIDAGKALQEGRDMHPSDQAFGNWCSNEFPELGSRTRSNMMAIARRFGQHLNAHQLGYSVLAELAAPSVSDDVAEQVINAPTPMKLAEVKALKKSVSTGQKTPNTEPLVHNITMIASCFIGVRTNLMMHKDVNSVASVSDYDLARAISFEVQKHYDDQETEAVLLELKELALQLSKAVEITLTETDHNVVAFNSNLKVVGQEEADLISYQKQKQIEATPQQFDLLEHVKSTKSYDLNVTARCLNVCIEQLHWKSDRSEIKEAIRAAIIDDVIGIKVPALHGLAEILRELADEMPVINATKLN